MTKITITSSEGLPIRGDFDLPAKPRALAVVVHGFKGFKDWGFFPWLAERLCNHGIAVCRFNMSRNGIGENPEEFDRLDLFADDTYTGQIRDLRAAVEYAQQECGQIPTFLVGHSRGGGVAILAASEIAYLRGVVTWSAISTVDRSDDAAKRKWRRDGYFDIENTRTKQMMRMSTAILDDYEAHRERLDILAATERLRVPLLVIHGEDDESVPVMESELITDRAPEASRAVIAHAGHTYNAIHPLIDVPFALSMAAELTAHFVTAYA
jgi:alpha-beta hydrolase superfamily lysophospholipase